MSVWVLWCPTGGCATAAIATGNPSARPGITCIKSLERRGRGADGGLPSGHSPSLLSQAEGAGGENESVEHVSKEVLCAQHPFGPCSPSPQDVEAKTLAMIKEGFPGRGTTRNTQCLRQTHFVLSVFDGTSLRGNRPAEPARGGWIQLRRLVLPAPERGSQGGQEGGAACTGDAWGSSCGWHVGAVLAPPTPPRALCPG